MALVFMLIDPTFLSVMLAQILTLPWSRLLPLHHLCSEGLDPRWVEAIYVTWLLGAGLINTAIVFGISRLFKKSIRTRTA
jgi:hypothetical protein